MRAGGPSTSTHYNDITGYNTYPEQTRTGRTLFTLILTFHWRDSVRNFLPTDYMQVRRSINIRHNSDFRGAGAGQIYVHSSSAGAVGGS